ncbi:unnamed protein product [Larinioides sclopetarius]|uniref:Ubiquinone biosynthesis protein n=1 Tax=Larinioides sclopetarius TaxID=280406 RepID=A0AAV1ZU84_9ARAC
MRGVVWEKVMSRFSLLTWRLSVSVFSKIDKTLYRKCLNQYSFSSIRQVTSLTKVLQTPEHQTEVASDSDSDDEKAEDLTDFRLQILKAGLDFVPDHGWSKQSIALGAQSLGLSSSSHSLIEDGGADLVHYFNFLCNEKLEDYLKEKYSSNKEKPVCFERKGKDEGIETQQLILIGRHPTLHRRRFDIQTKDDHSICF